MFWLLVQQYNPTGVYGYGDIPLSLHYLEERRGKAAVGDLCLLTPSNTVLPTTTTTAAAAATAPSLPGVNTTETADSTLISLGSDA